MGAPEIDIRVESSIKSTDAPPEKTSQRPSVMIEKVRAAVVKFACAMVVMLFCFGAPTFGVNIAAIFFQKDIAIGPYNVLTDAYGNALQVQADHMDENPFDLPRSLMETQELQELQTIQVHTDGGALMSWTVTKVKFGCFFHDAQRTNKRFISAFHSEHRRRRTHVEARRCGTGRRQFQMGRCITADDRNYKNFR